MNRDTLSHERFGIETRVERTEEFRPLFEIHRDLKNLRALDQEGKEPELRRELMRILHGHYGLETADDAESERAYEHLERSISNASKALSAYFRDVLVVDLLQRVSVTNEVASVTDPLSLVDIMLSSSDERVRFEARSALHFGALFYEYDMRYGNEVERRQRMNEITLFLDAILFSSGEKKDVRLFHQVKNDAGALVASNIRVPALDGSSRRRQNDEENIVPLSLREIKQPFLSSREGRWYGIFEARPKDPLSAALKSIRRNKPLSALRDVHGVSLSVYQKEGTELSRVLTILEKYLTIDPSDRLHHPTCLLHNPVQAAEQDNPYTSQRYKPEKFIARWSPQTLLHYREMVAPYVEELFKLNYSQNEFWRHVERSAGKTLDVEFQLGTLADYLNVRLIGGDENHRFYKLKQNRGDRTRQDARGTLELLRPPSLYDIQWDKPYITEALSKKALAEIGIHGAALKLFVEGEE